MFYLKSIRLKNICCFEDTPLHFCENGKPSNVILFLGNNGTGKTTILRCIALGLCDVSSSIGLIQELYGDIIREGKNEADIDIEVCSGSNDESFLIKKKLKRTATGNIIVENPSEDFPTEKFFVCGYGAARSYYGQKPISEYSLTDSVYSLFNYDHQLQNSELIISVHPRL